MTTLINTHDMNSVMGIGKKSSIFTKDTKNGKAIQDGNVTSANERLNSFMICI